MPQFAFVRAAFMAAGFALALAHAQSLPQLPPAKGEDTIVEWDSQEFELNGEGGFTALVDHRQRILTAEGARNRAAHRLSYFQSHGRSVDWVEVVDAYTQKANGKLVRVSGLPSAGARVPLSGGLPSGALFFPNVEAGDLLVLRYKLGRQQGVFPGQFEDVVMPLPEPTKSARVRYRVPSKFVLHSYAAGWDATPERRDGEFSVYEWKSKGGARARVEQGAVSSSLGDRHLAVSTFEDWPAMAKAYSALAERSDTPSPEVQEIARQVTSGMKSPKAKALALAHWVRDNVRYIALPVTVASATPERVQAVLANRFTDCKGHVALLSALLGAAGIEDTAALINSGDGYSADGVPTLGALNHVINYVPALALFLDTTAKDSAPEYLPESVLGKRALLVSTGSFVPTPVQNASAVVTQSHLATGSAGELSWQHRAVFSGAGAEPLYRTMAALSEGDLRKYATAMLQAQGWEPQQLAHLSLQWGDGKTSQQSDLTIRVQAFVEPPTFSSGSAKDARRHISLKTGSFSSIAIPVQNWLSEPVRTQPFLCPGVDVVEKLRIDLPGDSPELKLPTPVNVNALGYHYRSTYEYAATGRSIEVERSLKSQRNSRVCSAADYSALRPFLLTVQRDLRSKAIVDVGNPDTANKQGLVGAPAERPKMLIFNPGVVAKAYRRTS